MILHRIACPSACMYAVRVLEHRTVCCAAAQWVDPVTMHVNASTAAAAETTSAACVVLTIPLVRAPKLLQERPFVKKNIVFAHVEA